ncbi:hypothetical protein [Novosphingobium sp. 9]|uniref:hypothetical protein n=1 Tax=Novosphingobium sp. 9 TaxID=2025349 RepID=UPI0021B5EF7B|nr:hypothetical protein [Novosphingobium sp. 9]
MKTLRATGGLFGALALAIVGAGASAPALADPGAENTLALEALHNYALCAVQRTPDGAVKLLAMDHTSSEYNAELRRFAKGHSYCTRTGTELKFTGLPFAGDLAEAVLATRYEGRSLANAAAALDAERRKAAGQDADGKPVDAPTFRAFAASHADTVSEAVGLCVVLQKPDAVAALLKTSPNSPEELAALQPTGADLPGCVPEGVTMKLNRPAVRAMYALGAYRLLAGPQVHPEG